VRGAVQLEGVARQYKMVVPPYFALVLRAFSVIEGIAMQHNGAYRIVGSCFPYLSQRLLTDDHPRMQARSPVRPRAPRSVQAGETQLPVDAVRNAEPRACRLR
jgi:predicted unusual protein kinase regulating ubiquinone biosynthesis (AarF/ABC1/UbiB family)